MQHTELPASTANNLPDPYSHGYLYGSASVAMVGTPPYSPQIQAAARAGTLLPKDYTGLNHSFAAAAGGVISTANDPGGSLGSGNDRSARLSTYVRKNTFAEPTGASARASGRTSRWAFILAWL